VVAKVSRGKDAFLQIRVRPAVNLSKLEEVLVITQREERTPEVSDKSIRAADILSRRLPSVPDQPAAPVPGQPATGAAAQTAQPGAAKPASLTPAGVNAGIKPATATPATAKPGSGAKTSETPGHEVRTQSANPPEAAPAPREGKPE